MPEVQHLLMGAGVISNERLVFAGWLLSMVQRIGMHTVCEHTMRRLHGDTVYPTTIPHTVAFKEAGAAGVPVTHHAPKTAAAKVVRAVYAETMQRMQRAWERGAA